MALYKVQHEKDPVWWVVAPNLRCALEAYESATGNTEYIESIEHVGTRVATWETPQATTSHSPSTTSS